jgi:hypothetical protein
MGRPIAVIRRFYEQELRAYWAEADRGVLDQYRLESPSGDEQRRHLPRSVQKAYAFYKEQVQDEDWGNVYLLQVPVEGVGPTYAVRVTTDGDDGWLEVFDAQGRNAGVGRTYLEWIAWGPAAAIRAQVDTGEYPARLADKLPPILRDKVAGSETTHAN